MPDCLPEAVRNARLRVVDWRFLLSSPRPQRVLCRARGLLAEAVTSIADEVVDTSTGGDCDLAVAEDPDGATLRDLRACLRPGGACYVEWRTGVGRTRAEAELRAAGFGEIALYRRWPRTPGTPVFWIPVNAPGAATYVRSRARLRGGRVRRLLAEVAHRARELGHGRAGDSLCAIAWPIEAPGVPGAAGWLRSSWAEWHLGATPPHLSILLVTGGPRTVSKVVGLVFEEPLPVPVLAIKAARVDEAAAGVRREAEALEHLEARGIHGVPRLLGRREARGVPFLVETALVGRPLESVLTAASLGRWSASVTDWLAMLARGAAPGASSSWLDRIVTPALARFEETFGRVVDRALLRDGQDIVRRIGDLPSVPEQRDLGPWNVLAAPDGHVAVLDWESAELEGLPALDLLYYLAYASFHVERARHREARLAAFERSLDPSTRTGAIRAECLARYLDAAGIDPGQLAPLRALVWMIHTHSDYRHAAADVGGTPPDALLRRSLFLAMWTAEMRSLAGR